jgi:N-acetylmuramoyl-L-alanine amidase
MSDREQINSAIGAAMAAIEERLSAATAEQRRSLRQAYLRLASLETSDTPAASPRLQEAARRLEELVRQGGAGLEADALADATASLIGDATETVGTAPRPAPVATAPGSLTVPSSTASNTSAPAQWQRLVEQYRQYARVSPQLKIASLAQWIVESARGTSPLARDQLNFAGLKFRERMKNHAGFVDYRGADGEQTLYCKFDSLAAFFDGYWHFIDSGPYDGWKEYSEDAAGYVRHIADKYSADRNYLTKVLANFDEAIRLLGSAGAAGGSASPGSRRSADHRLAIVVGHNARAKGAYGLPPIDRYEFDYNSAVAAAMKNEAIHYNLELEVFFREPHASYTEEIRRAYAQVSAWRPDCALELHFNSFATSAANGSEVLYRTDSGEALAFARSLIGSIHQALRLNLRGGDGLVPVQRGQRGSASLYALAQVPTLLLEPFFGSNAQDCLRAATLGERSLGLAYLRGVRDWVVARQLAA